MPQNEHEWRQVYRRLACLTSALETLLEVSRDTLAYVENYSRLSGYIGIHSLPDELLENIVDLLSDDSEGEDSEKRSTTREILRISHVSRRFRTVKLQM